LGDFSSEELVGLRERGFGEDKILFTINRFKGAKRLPVSSTVFMVRKNK